MNMLEFILCLGFVGAICFASVAIYVLFVMLMHAIYKVNGGKMPLREYFKYW